MHPAHADRSLQSTLAWARERMRNKGYDIRSSVTLSVDPKLAIMGYARKEGEGHAIVISEWALDSEMLGGLVLHELAHIYFTEKGAHSHDGEMLEKILQEMKEREGLRAKETEYLIDSFNHLQNILVDDVVFDVMQDRELENARRFFSEWVSDKPSGDPVLDAALLCRNAFATASLRRRKLFDPASDMFYRNKEFLSALGEHADGEFEWIEGFLEHASAKWEAEEYRRNLAEYFERILSSMRSSSKMHDLR
jgi:predicted phosphatase